MIAATGKVAEIMRMEDWAKTSQTWILSYAPPGRVVRRPLPRGLSRGGLRSRFVERLVASVEGLRLEAESEFLVATGARVYVIWRAKIGDLGVVNHVLEVHRAVSIDSAILNSMEAGNDPAVKKLEQSRTRRTRRSQRGRSQR